MTFQTEKATFVRDLLGIPPKVSKAALAQRGEVLGGAIERYYDRLSACNVGNQQLGLAIGGALVENFESVRKALLHRPLIGIPELIEIEKKEDGLRNIHLASYQMGFDYTFYWALNGPGGFNTPTARLLTNLNLEVRRKPIASILDLAATNKATGAITHIYEILEMILDDFARVTEAAPVKPPSDVLAQPFR